MTVRIEDQLAPDEELQPWALRQFERAYQQRARERGSREDFYAGYRAALIDLKAWSQFKTKPHDVS